MARYRSSVASTTGSSARPVLPRTTNAFRRTYRASRSAMYQRPCRRSTVASSAAKSSTTSTLASEASSTTPARRLGDTPLDTRRSRRCDRPTPRGTRAGSRRALAATTRDSAAHRRHPARRWRLWANRRGNDGTTRSRRRRSRSLATRRWSRPIRARTSCRDQATAGCCSCRTNRGRRGTQPRDRRARCRRRAHARRSRCRAGDRRPRRVRLAPRRSGRRRRTRRPGRPSASWSVDGRACTHDDALRARQRSPWIGGTFGVAIREVHPGVQSRGAALVEIAQRAGERRRRRDAYGIETGATSERRSSSTSTVPLTVPRAAAVDAGPARRVPAAPSTAPPGSARRRHRHGRGRRRA